MALLLWWVVKNWNKQREIIFGLALYALPLSLMLPVLSVGTAELRNDRYAYLPCLGIFFLLMLLMERVKPAVLRYGLLTGIAALFAFQAIKIARSIVAVPKYGHGFQAGFATRHCDQTGRKRK